MTRRYLLEQIDDAAVVQDYADGFNALPVDQKILTWHLYQAALAGRDIYYDQRYSPSLAMREILEEILTHSTPWPDALTGVLAEIRRYTKLFWINSGPHNNMTSRKFVLKCRPDELRASAEAALANGASFPCAEGETLAMLLDRLHGPFFEPSVDTMVTSKTPGEGRDILEASANNLYSGVTMADLDGFAEQYGLNSRLVKEDGQLVEEILSRERAVRGTDPQHRLPPAVGARLRTGTDAGGARSPHPFLRVR